jgi:hypothetical protein
MFARSLHLVIADPRQLVTQALVIWIVLYRVRLAAVHRHSAAGTLRESGTQLQIRSTRLARGQAASSSFSLVSLRIVDRIDDLFLRAGVDERGENDRNNSITQP